MKTYILSPALPLLAILTLAACGGGSSGGDGDGSSPEGTTLRDVIAQDQMLEDALDVATFTDPADIPDTGSATYVGLMSFGADEGVQEGSLDGQMTLNVGFAGGGDISGSVTDFVFIGEIDPDNLDLDAALPTVDGTLTFENGSIDPDAIDQIQGEMNGTLVSSVDTWGVAAGTELNVAGIIEGEFLDGAGSGSVDIVDGFTSGTITPDGGAAIDIDFGGFTGIAN